ncbi:MAG: Flagellar biosynthetic protein FliR [Pseudomonadota bacterium]|jgi:flagellar biosynthetic protein FliR
MNIELATLMDHFYKLMWPMLRISALLMTAPIFSLNALNLRIRILFGLALTVMVYPLYDWPVIDPLSGMGLLEMANQITLGVLMGLTLQVVVAAVLVAGQTISNSVGLSMATLIDPNTGNVPVLSQFLIILSTLIFIGLGGHALLIGMVIDSFSTMPIGKSLLSASAWTGLAAWSSMMFLGALLTALPVVVTMLFINMGLGITTRAAPALNIFSVGFPALLLAGFAIMIMSLPSMGARIQWLWLQGLQQVNQLLGIA